jgi:hypothetical protein
MSHLPAVGKRVRNGRGIFLRIPGRETPDDVIGATFNPDEGAYCFLGSRSGSLSTVSKPYQNPICSGCLGYLSSEEQVPQVVENPEHAANEPPV